MPEMHSQKPNASMPEVRDEKMVLSIRLQYELELAMQSAFPLYPIPQGPDVCNSQLEWAVKNEVQGRPWSDVVGLGLTYGELDPSLSIWYRAFPAEFVDYYLPSHLKLAGMLLPFGSLPDYVDRVMEALFLPPTSDPAQLQEIEDELCHSSSLINLAPERRSLFGRLSQPQRECIALFLDWYLTCREAEFTPFGKTLFIANRDYWRNASLPG